MGIFENIKIIGIDHGYGYIKTANYCFPARIVGYDQEPLFTRNMLIYHGRYYLIGEGHKEFKTIKIVDKDHYLPTWQPFSWSLRNKI